MSVSRNCIPVSSSCVLWHGPNIECIGLYKDDSIQDVLYKLGEFVCSLNAQLEDCNCNGNNNDNLIYSCVLLDGKHEVFGQNSQEFLTYVASWICDMMRGDFSIIGLDGESLKSLNTPLPLPPEMQYENEDGQSIVEVDYREYIILLSEKIVEIYNNYIEVGLDILEIKNDILEIQNWINRYKEPGEITITSKCASSLNPGEVIEISEAFENLEDDYCNYKSLLGTNSQWTLATGEMCVGLREDSQLLNPEAIMSELPNWIYDPITVAENYNNLWLTICDLRESLKMVMNNSNNVPCILLPPINLSIDNITTMMATISWDISNINSIKQPVGFLVEVYNSLNGVQGNLIYSETVDANTYTKDIMHPSISYKNDYIVKVSVIYECGMSEPLTITGKLKESLIFYEIKVSEVIVTNTTSDCDGTNYPYQIRKTKVKIVNKGSGDPVTLGEDVEVVLRYDKWDNTTVDVPIVILSGTSENYHQYTAIETVLDINGDCQEETQTFSCGVSIDNSSCEFESSVEECL